MERDPSPPAPAPHPPDPNFTENDDGGLHVPALPPADHENDNDSGDGLSDAAEEEKEEEEVGKSLQGLSSA